MSQQQRTALAGRYLILDIWWNRIQSPQCILSESLPSPPLVLKPWRTRAHWNSPSFPQSLGSDLKQHAASEQKHHCCSLETNKKGRKQMPKAEGEREIRQAEHSPEPQQLADTDKCLVHCWLLNIVSDQCNQEQSPHYNEQVGRYLRLSDTSVLQAGKYSL